MNENLKNYSETPDPEVWNHIQQTKRHTYIRRQTISAAIGAAVVAASIISVTLWPSRLPNNTDTSSEVSLAWEPDTPVIHTNDLAINKPTTKVQSCNQHTDTLTAIAKPIIENHTYSEPIPSTTQTTAPTANIRQTPMISPMTAPTIESVEIPITAPSVSDNLPVTTQESATPKVNSNNPTNTVQDTILWIPNIFAPASDNPDLTIFRPRLNKSDVSISNYRLTIFNRSGHQVFRSSDINYGWDGTYKGTALPQASYVYVIYYTDKDGLSHQRKGTITLVR